MDDYLKEWIGPDKKSGLNDFFQREYMIEPFKSEVVDSKRLFHSPLQISSIASVHSATIGIKHMVDQQTKALAEKLQSESPICASCHHREFFTSRRDDMFSGNPVFTSEARCAGKGRCPDVVDTRAILTKVPDNKDVPAGSYGEAW